MLNDVFMKKVFLLMALAVTVTVNAQILEVQSLQKVNVTANVPDAKIAGISPAGDYILITAGDHKGLTRYDFATRQSTVISTAAGAGYNVKVSNDGKQIVYRETVIGKDHLRRQNIIRRDFTKRSNTVLARLQRTMSKMRLTDAQPEVTINDRLMELESNGRKTVLAPNGTDKSYIWPSVSPDGQHICYYVCADGCYVCNIDGTNPQRIAHDCRAAKWYDNNTIIGMNDEDDGEVIYASSLVAYTLDGRMQTLTDASVSATYPYAIDGAIVFTSLKGETYLMNVK